MIFVLASLTGCAAVEDKSDYHRHSMSDLREDRQRSGVLFFEATSSAMYPADSDAAEAVRMEWLAAWMKRTRNCPDGWQVISRTAIDPTEIHARRHDLRYEVKCAAMGK